MQFQFDGKQRHQIRAIEAVADLFHGQPRVRADWGNQDWFGGGKVFGPVPNRLELVPAKLLSNLQRVQAWHGLPVETELKTIREKIKTADGEIEIDFPNFSVEMETGTGKTYVYLRTALELFRRYGLGKFIIVVPSVAIREGVLKTLKITEQHLRTLYGNVPYRFSIYESKNLTKVREFAQSADSVEIMLMTLDSFNKDENVIRQRTDRLQGATPIYLIQTARPVLILDEPQNMESEGSIRALANLHPLLALRYSATHRNPYNLVYRLTPFEAYRYGLVKKLEVASVVKENDFNQVFMRLDEIRSSRTTVTAKITVHKRMATGTIKEKPFTFRQGDNLEPRAERPEYASFQIDEINKEEGFVRFANNIILRLHEARGADQQAIWREQVRYTIGQHLVRQKKLQPLGIKVLSLFFIDKVENYAGEDAILRKLFDEAFEEIKSQYGGWKDRRPEEVRQAYFAQKTRRGGSVEFVESSTGKSEADRDAYTLIMQDKERLLSFQEPTAFIFSHSALREGWDNPNVFQICTLNQTASEVKKRQEVGRGMRLAVTQSGERIQDEKVNVLTVIANESYEQFVKTYQEEMIEAFGVVGAAPKPPNQRQKKTVKRKSEMDFPPEFRALWEKIKPKTRYNVTVETETLLADVIKALNNIPIDPPTIMITKADVKLQDRKNEFTAFETAKKRGMTPVGTFAVPNVVLMMEQLMEQTTPPVRLTRKTLCEVVKRYYNPQAAIDNPEDFASKAVAIIKEKVADQLVNGIEYEKDGEFYDLSQFEPELESSSESVVSVERSIYDFVILDSQTEKAFVEALEKNNQVKVYVKLPNWFKVRTPVGNYNPDWAIVMEESNEFGEVIGKQLYLVRETKSSLSPDDMRPDERRKIVCGKQHFEGALGVNYKVVRNAGELL